MSHIICPDCGDLKKKKEIAQNFDTILPKKYEIAQNFDAKSPKIHEIAQSLDTLHQPGGPVPLPPPTPMHLNKSVVSSHIFM